MDVEKIRGRFRPDQIRVLFVGESPPDSGKFVYCGNSQMARHMKRVLGAELFSKTEDFSNVFAASGCYLDDLVLKPVNKAPERLRKQARTQAIPSLAERIREYRPRVVVALLRKIEQDVHDAVDRSGIDARFCVTHFPGNGQQGRFESDIKQLLPVLRNAIERHDFWSFRSAVRFDASSAQS